MFVLTTAIKQGIDPYRTYYTSKPLNLDLPEWGHWEVHTADEGYLGTVNLQQATVASDNTVFAQLDLDVGPENVARTAAQSMGDHHASSTGSPPRGSAACGSASRRWRWPMPSRRSPPAAIHRNPIAIRKVEFPGGRVDHPEEPDPRRVLPANVAYEVTRILHDNITSGTGTAAYTGCYGQAGKTGTTDNYVDAWFDGYQPNLATAVWVGYPQSNEIEMSSVHGITVFGGTFPAEIWNAFYSGIGVPCEDFPVPARADRAGPRSPAATRPRRRAPTTTTATPRNGASDGTGRRATTAAGGYDPNALRARRRRPAAGPGAALAAPAPTPPPPAPAAAVVVGGGGDRRGPADRRRRRRRRDVGVGRLRSACSGWRRAVPLAAPGPGLVPGAVGGGPDWLLGLYGDGTGVGAGAYYGLPLARLRLLPCASVGRRRR